MTTQKAQKLSPSWPPLRQLRSTVLVRSLREMSTRRRKWASNRAKVLDRHVVAEHVVEKDRQIELGGKLFLLRIRWASCLRVIRADADLGEPEAIGSMVGNGRQLSPFGGVNGATNFTEGLRQQRVLDPVVESVDQREVLSHGSSKSSSVVEEQFAEAPILDRLPDAFVVAEPSIEQDDTTCQRCTM